MATSSAIKLIASIFGASSICVCPVYRLIAFEAVQKLLVARDESPLLRFVELARHTLRLVIDKTKPMQQCDQPRVAVAKLIILPKPGPNRIRAAGQPHRDKGFQSR